MLTLKNNEVLSGSKVFIVTNSQDITMPNMIGWSLNDVKTFASLIGLKLEYNGYGYVISQSIGEGEKLDLTNMTLSIELQKK